MARTRLAALIAFPILATAMLAGATPAPAEPLGVNEPIDQSDPPAGCDVKGAFGWDDGKPCPSSTKVSGQYP